MSRGYRIHIEATPADKALGLLAEGRLCVDHSEVSYGTLVIEGTITLSGGADPMETHEGWATSLPGVHISTDWWLDEREPDHSFVSEEQS